MAMNPVLDSVRALFGKLEREGYRCIHAKSAKHKADHFFNFCVTAHAMRDFFLEDNNLGPPYYRIEIDLSSTSSFESGDTPQRSISVLGRWGYEEDTESVGTVASGLSSGTTATTMVGNRPLL